MNKVFKISILILMILSVVGCKANDLLSPQTEAANQTGYTYVPIDPFSIKVTPHANCYPVEAELDDPILYEHEKSFFSSKISQTEEDKETLEKYRAAIMKKRMNENEYIKQALENLKNTPLLKSLPDNTVRMSIHQLDSNGNINYGPVGLGSKKESYKVTIDYVNSDTLSFPVTLRKFVKELSSGKIVNVDINSYLDKNVYDLKSVFYQVEEYDYSRGDENENDFSTLYSIPLYVGVGLRVTASIDIIGAKANISGLGIIGAEAEANNLKGSLVIQTLGINGNAIAAALPIQSELNRTTAQNAIVAVGAIKALLYDEEITTVPRIVGMYLPFPSNKLVLNNVISLLSSGREIMWKRSCSKSFTKSDA